MGDSHFRAAPHPPSGTPPGEWVDAVNETCGCSSDLGLTPNRENFRFPPPRALPIWPFGRTVPMDGGRTRGGRFPGATRSSRVRARGPRHCDAVSCARRQVDAAKRPEARLGHLAPGCDHRDLPDRGGPRQEEAIRGPSAQGRGDGLRPGLHRQRRRDQARRGRPGRRARQHRRRPAPVVLPHEAARRDAQGRRRGRQPGPRRQDHRAGDRPGQDPDGDLHQGPDRRRARAPPGQRDDQPGGGLPDADPAPRDDDRRGRAQGGPGARHRRRGR